ncbi:MAG: NAD(P)-dependent oxidoreductase [Nanoarchaeota archaeon]|nr:NAD(P)-dependent oxidoreductase [Nanoarchaeota archaeon]
MTNYNTPKVLLTGAFGNIGQHTLEALLHKNYAVRAFDLDTPDNRKRARKFNTEVVFGNIVYPDAVTDAVKGVDAVVHLAAIIPPKSEHDPNFSYTVNVRGTRNIVKAMKQHGTAHLVYASSVAVHGCSHHRPCLSIDDPFEKTNCYTEQKITCEWELDQESIAKTILRFGAVIPLERKPDPLMFEVSLDAKIETVHPDDAALAAANAVLNSKAEDKKYFIGGGADFQMTYRQFLTRALENLGIGMLPDTAFSDDLFHTNYMDTAEAQHDLKFQNHSFQDFLDDVRKAQGCGIHLLKIPFMRSLVRQNLLKLSPYYTQTESL